MIDFLDRINDIGGTIAVVTVMCVIFVLKSHSERIKKLEDDFVQLDEIIHRIDKNTDYIRGKMEAYHDE